MIEQIICGIPMRTKKIEEISRSAVDLANSAAELVNYFTNSNTDGDIIFDVKKTLHGTDISFSDCLSRITTISGIAEKFDKSSQFILVPLPRITQLKQSIDETQQRLDAISNQISQVIQSGGGFQSFNYDSFIITTANGATHNLAGIFKNFADVTENLLESFHNVLVILRPSKATYSFQAAANALSTLIDKASDEIQNINSEHAKLKKASSTIEKMVVDVKSSSEETARLKDESAKDRKSISEYLSEATEKKTNIETINAAANKLEDKVAEYQESFESFDRQLKNRNADFEEGKRKQEGLFSKFDEQSKSVADLIIKSESMLKGATVAGLASSFSDAHRKLGWQLFWARISFYFGILFLFISAIPLMVYVFLPVIAPFAQDRFPELANIPSTYSMFDEVTGWQYLGQVLARFIILLPAAWFVSFSAIRHSSLFRLREHYAYKYSMAVSVEGFRKQAEGYESEIAALVLEQLAFNPADKLVHSKEIREGKVPHPMLDLFLNKFRSGLDKEKP